MNNLLRFSDLKLMGRSPLHYRHRAAQGQTDSMEKGTALHALVFETRKVVCYPGKQRRGADFEAFKSCNEGAAILTATAYDAVHRMAEAVLEHPEAWALLRGPGVVTEATLHFDYLGRAARGTPDARCPEWIADLKSCKTSDPEPFMWQAKRLAYHAQLAFYGSGVRSLGLGTSRTSYVVAVESTAPNPVTVLRLSDRTLDQGERLCRLWFERLLACEAANAWPPYVQSIVDWDIGDDDEDVGLVFADEADDEEAA